MIIRQEQNKDYDTVYQVVKTAFASTAESDGNEQNLVNALRRSESFIPYRSSIAGDNRKFAHMIFISAVSLIFLQQQTQLIRKEDRYRKPHGYPECRHCSMQTSPYARLSCNTHNMPGRHRIYKHCRN